MLPTIAPLPLHVVPVAGAFDPGQFVDLVPVLLAATVYFAAYLRQRARSGPRVTPAHAILYGIGIAAAALALAGPPAVWADDLFSAHMAQHLLLILVAPPLILAGRPVQTLVRGMPKVSRAVTRHAARLAKALRGPSGSSLPTLHRLTSSPFAAFCAFNGVLVLWHFPPAYDLAVRSDSVHIIEHVSFFGAAVLFWRLIIDPVPRHHRASSHAVIGLAFGTCMVGNVLAAAITLAPSLLYESYAAGIAPGVEAVAATSAATRAAGAAVEAVAAGSATTPAAALDPLTDQRIGGLIMWLSGIVYFGLIFWVLSRESVWGDPRPSSPNLSESST